MNCPSCGALAPAGTLACPTCDALLHRARLRELAEVAERAGNPTDALTAWREALGLLPPDSKQYIQVHERVLALSRELDAPARAPAPAPGARRGRIGGALAAAGAGLWQLKTLLLLSLGKLKFLLLGFSKLGTVLSMLASFGVYASLWGWRFAAGFVLSIYVHEIGHVVALRQFGIAATAPMFIPGFGALVRLKQYPSTPREDARVGIAGPIWGTGASIVAWLLGVAFTSPLLHAIAATSAFINLFNLIPLFSLDGGRAVRGMSRLQRGIVVGALGLAWAFTSVPMTFLVALVLLGRTLTRSQEPTEGDDVTTGWFVLLAFVLSALAMSAPM
jgi:Zn-dependent protease